MHCVLVGVTEPILQGEDVKDYLGKAVNPVLVQGLTCLCKEKPEDPIVSGGWGRGREGKMWGTLCTLLLTKSQGRALICFRSLLPCL